MIHEKHSRRRLRGTLLRMPQRHRFSATYTNESSSSFDSVNGMARRNEKKSNFLWIDRFKVHFAARRNAFLPSRGVKGKQWETLDDEERKSFNLIANESLRLKSSIHTRRQWFVSNVPTLNARSLEIHRVYQIYGILETYLRAAFSGYLAFFLFYYLRQCMPAIRSAQSKQKEGKEKSKFAPLNGGEGKGKTRKAVVTLAH